MKQSHWKSDGKNVFVAKAVVSATGHAVGKNYDRQKLEPGDVGLEVRLDRNQVEAMTPEQRTAAQAVAQGMIQEFQAALGVEQEPGFVPGMVVRLVADGEERHGLLHAATEFVYTIRELLENGKTRLVGLPVSQYSIEELPQYQGLEGLVLKEIDDRLLVNEALAAHLKSQEALKTVFLTKNCPLEVLECILSRLLAETCTQEEYAGVFLHCLEPIEVRCRGGEGTKVETTAFKILDRITDRQALYVLASDAAKVNKGVIWREGLRSEIVRRFVASGPLGDGEHLRLHDLAEKGYLIAVDHVDRKRLFRLVNSCGDIRERAFECIIELGPLQESEMPDAIKFLRRGCTTVLPHLDRKTTIELAMTNPGLIGKSREAVGEHLKRLLPLSQEEQDEVFRHGFAVADMDDVLNWSLVSPERLTEWAKGQDKETRDRVEDLLKRRASVPSGQ